MNNPLKEELVRFKKLFVNYSKVIVGGMLLSSVFLFFYAGIRANYLSIVILTAVVSTISLSLIILLLYVKFQEKRLKSSPEKRFIGDWLTEPQRTDDEELRRLIVEAIAGLPSTETKASQKPALLVSVFQWGYVIGKLFYCGLTTVKLEFGFGKDPKQV